MSRTDADRFNSVAERFEKLVGQNRARAQKLTRAGVDRYLAMCEEVRDTLNRRKQQQRDAVRQVLRAGRIRADFRHGDQVSVFTVGMKIPRPLLAETTRALERLAGKHLLDRTAAGLLGRESPPEPPLPARLQRQLAAAALCAIEWEDRIAARGTSLAGRARIEEEYHQRYSDESCVHYTLQVWYVKPRDVQGSAEPPSSQRWEYLRALPQSDLRAIAFARIGALRDARRLDQLLDDWVPKTDDPWVVNDRAIGVLLRDLDLDAIVPVDMGANAGVPDVKRETLQPDIAERLIDVVERAWADAECLAIDETGGLRMSACVEPDTLFRAIVGQINLFLSQLELCERRPEGGFSCRDRNAGLMRGVFVLWDRVMLMVGAARGLAVDAANPLTPGQRTALAQPGGVVAIGPVSAHRNFLPVDDVLAQVLYASPFEKAADGTEFVSAAKADMLRRLAAALGRHSAGVGTAATDENAPSSAPPPPASDTNRQGLGPRLTPGEQALWDGLVGRAGSAKALAKLDGLDTSEQTIREHIRAIRSKRGKTAIDKMSGYGFYRPDAAPDWSKLSPKRQRRIRTA